MRSSAADNATMDRIDRSDPLDGLRTVAVMGVVMAHVGYFIAPGGYLGVDVFFVLSGFLITRILLKEKEEFGNIEIKRFYARRALRLYPALIASVLIAVALPLSFSKISSSVLSLSYLMDVARSSGLFTEQDAGPLGVTWSLAVEEHFYLVWPVLITVVLSRATNRRWLLGTCVVLALTTWVALVVLSTGDRDTDLLYYRPDLRSAALFVGAIVALAPAKAVVRMAAVPTVFAASVVVVMFQFATGKSTTVAFAVYMPATWLCTAIIIASIQVGRGGIVGRLLGLPVLSYVGRRSYGIYLYHIPVVAMVGRTDLRFSVKLILFVLLPVAIASVSFRLLERPFLRLKDERLSRE